MEQLGASRYNEREEAMKALEAMGYPALPALREGRKSKDPEVRQRVVSLINKIESERMIRATQVQLHFKDRPISEVVAAITEQTGISLTLMPPRQAMWDTRRISLESSEPVTFWTALDRLCQAAQLRHGSAVDSGMLDGRGMGLHLLSGTAAGAGPISDDGPFRCQVTGLHYQKDLTFGQGGRVLNGQILVQPEQPGTGGPAQGMTTEQFSFDLFVMAEPRMLISPTGTPKLVEAIDDKGQSLLPPQAGRRQPADLEFLRAGYGVGVPYPGAAPVSLETRADDQAATREHAGQHLRSQGGSSRRRPGRREGQVVPVG